MAGSRQISQGSQRLRDLIAPPVTGRQVAEEIGVTQQAVSAWAHGISKPSREKAVLLERKFGIEVGLWEADGSGEAA